jgi:hypothetical protein
MCVKRPWRERFCSKTIMCSRLVGESSSSILVQVGNNSTGNRSGGQETTARIIIDYLIVDKTKVRGIKRGVGVVRSQS